MTANEPIVTHKQNIPVMDLLDERIQTLIQWTAKWETEQFSDIQKLRHIDRFLWDHTSLTSEKEQLTNVALPNHFQADVCEKQSNSNSYYF